MAYTVIECTDTAALNAYRESQEFKDTVLTRPGVKVSSGHSDDVELDDQGTTGRMFWLLIEDSVPEDNTTFRLNNGKLEFWASGVEV